ncbi:uncharacterized protein LOC136063172 [Quercus suber]|uniref:uncharacterized protein LOC136063172 n=1 Tax=Quercus suber TaxID=58331 RepID=UPI0032E02456
MDFKIGNGDLGEGDGDNYITIPHDLIIQPTQNPLQDTINSTYPDLDGQYMDTSYIQDRAFLGPTNEVVEELNDYIISSINGVEHEYLSSDSICKASLNVVDQDILYHIEFLNNLRFLGFPNHKLTLKVGLPIMLLRNLNQNEGLCNGTRLIITKLATWVIEAKIIIGTNIGTCVFIPRITSSPSDSKWPFVLKRRQFPISVCFTMTINKSQGQSLKHVGVYLPRPISVMGNYVGWTRPEATKSTWDKAALAAINVNRKALNAIFCGVSLDEFHRIIYVTIAKEVWEILETTYEGTKKVKDTKLQMLTT